MNTKQAEYESALDRLRADLASRETQIMKDIRGEFLAGVGIVIGVLGLIIAGATFLGG